MIKVVKPTTYSYKYKPWIDQVFSSTFHLHMRNINEKFCAVCQGHRNWDELFLKRTSWVFHFLWVELISDVLVDLNQKTLNQSGRCNSSTSKLGDFSGKCGILSFIVKKNSFSGTLQSD